MTARPETCQWVFVHKGSHQNLITGCGDHYFILPESWRYCPHCGGRIVRDQPKEGE